jgi:hypothetical protein
VASPRRAPNDTCRQIGEQRPAELGGELLIAELQRRGMRALAEQDLVSARRRHEEKAGGDCDGRIGMANLVTARQ